jgi:isopentenyldiphosphate isomerase
MRRGDHFEDGAYHLVVHICIFSPDGRMLIQQRQPFKDGWPDKWDITVGGSALAGENSREAARREVFEEIGYPLDLTDVLPAMSVNFPRGFDDTYLLCAQPDLASLRLQPEEVQAVKWAGLDEILSMIDDGSFIPYRKNLIRLFFEMKDSLGAIQEE